MASSAFKSTTKRTPIGAYSSTDDSASSSHGKPHRRSRSLSRLSRRLVEPELLDGPRKGKFVNTVRGSDFPDISLDDLAIELFSDQKDRGRVRSFWGLSDNSSTAASVAQSRGRSVSRNPKPLDSSTLGHNCRRPRSVSRCPASDTEPDMEHSLESVQSSSVQKQPRSSRRCSLGTPSSQRNSNSSVTDEGGKDACSTKYGREKTIRAVYAEKVAEHPAEEDVNGRLCAALRRELKNAVDEIRMELEQNIQTKSYDAEDTATKPSRTRRRSNDRKKMTKWLNEEAEKYFEDFISSIEDSDMSSFEGERSDSSSTLCTGPNAKPPSSDCNAGVVSQKSSLSVQLEGVAFPWLHWETTHDSSPITCQKNVDRNLLPDTTKTIQVVGTRPSGGIDSATSRVSCSDESSPISSQKNINEPSRTVVSDTAKEARTSNGGCSGSASSRGSCSPGDSHRARETSDGGNTLKKCTTIQCVEGKARKVDDRRNEHPNLPSTEEFLLEILQQRHGINSGCLLLCHNLII